MGQQPGDQFSDYRLIRLVGSGGFAEVWLGKNQIDQREAAIKILNVLFLPTPEEQDKFLDEARHLKNLSHPNIIKLLDFGFQNDKPFLVLEYASNNNLRERHPRGSILPLNLIVNYVKQISSGLQYAHDNRIIHRDVKPENMLLNSKNSVLVSDFGIALPGQTLPYPKTQDIMGTISYMAPEQLDGHPAFASDQYSLAVMIYEWLCGSLPFRGTLAEIHIQQHSDLASHRKKIASISPILEQVLFKALSENVTDRFRRIQEFSDALEQAVKDPQAMLNLSTQNNQPAQNTVTSADPFASNPTIVPNPFAVSPAPASNPFAASPTSSSNLTIASNPFAVSPAPASNPFAASPAPSYNPLPANISPASNSLPASNSFSANPTPSINSTQAPNPFVPTPTPTPNPFVPNPTPAPNTFSANPTTPASNTFASNAGTQSPLSGFSPNNTPNNSLNIPGNPAPTSNAGSFNNPSPAANIFQNPVPNNPPQGPLVLPHIPTPNSFTASGGSNPFVAGGGPSPFTNASLPSNPSASTVAAQQQLGGNPFTSNLPPGSNGRQNTQSQSFNRAKWFTPWFNTRFQQDDKNQFFLYGGGTVDFIFAITLGIAVSLAILLKDNKTLELGWYIGFFTFLGAITFRILCAASKKRPPALFLAICLGIYWFLGSLMLGAVIRTKFPEPVPPLIIAFTILIISLILHIRYVLKNKR